MGQVDSQPCGMGVASTLGDAMSKSYPQDLQVIHSRYIIRSRLIGITRPFPQWMLTSGYRK
jgi:hypothetical protein